MSEAKCSRIDPNTFVRYRIEFGRRGRSFPSMEELKDFTKTPEFEKLNTEGHWIIKETREIISKNHK